MILYYVVIVNKLDKYKDLFYRSDVSTAKTK